MRLRAQRAGLLLKQKEAQQQQQQQQQQEQVALAGPAHAPAPAPTTPSAGRPPGSVPGQHGGDLPSDLIGPAHVGDGAGAAEGGEGHVQGHLQAESGTVAEGGAGTAAATPQGAEAGLQLQQAGEARAAAAAAVGPPPLPPPAVVAPLPPLASRSPSPKRARPRGRTQKRDWLRAWSGTSGDGSAAGAGGVGLGSKFARQASLLASWQKEGGGEGEGGQSPMSIGGSGAAKARAGGATAAAYVGPQIVMASDGSWQLEGCQQELVRAMCGAGTCHVWSWYVPCVRMQDASRSWYVLCVRMHVCYGSLGCAFKEGPGRSSGGGSMGLCADLSSLPATRGCGLWLAVRARTLGPCRCACVGACAGRLLHRGLCNTALVGTDTGLCR